MTFLLSIVSFIVTLGILVTIHEFGHFWVARLCGVKVLRFSVGFGKPLLTFNRKNDPTDYVIAGIPLGGYVKMLDENEGVVEDDEKKFAFNNKPLSKKAAIVLAGPIFNFIFAAIAFWLILTIGETGLKPIVGELNKSGYAAHSGLEIGDEIVAVNDRPAAIWRVAMGLMSTELLDGGEVKVSVIKADGRLNNVILSTGDGTIPEPSEIFDRIGIQPRLPTLSPVIAEVLRGEAADQAGLEPGDLIMSANGQAIESWSDWVKLTRASAKQTLIVDVLRNELLLQLRVTPKEIVEDGVSIGRIGVMPFVDEEMLKSQYATYSLGLFPAVSEAVTQTVSYSVLTLKLMGRMLIGEASVNNLSGPISLAQYAGQTASISFIAFLKFLAFVSISLGVINLLPIPMLDGGHLFFYLIEAIKGKPVSDKTQSVFMRLGMVVLLSLMVLAVFVDMSRLIH